MAQARIRLLGSRLLNAVCRTIVGLAVTDVLGGFVLVKRADLLSLPLDEIFTGYGDFAIRLHSAIEYRGWSVSEIPVYYQQRLAGHSKTSPPKHALQYLTAALKVRLKRCTSKKDSKRDFCRSVGHAVD